MSTDPAVAHLSPQLWAAANRLLVRKALAEFAHERLIAPVPRSGGQYAVATDDGAGEYRFAAYRLALEHWHIDPARITRLHQGQQRPLDLLDLVLDLRQALGIGDAQLPLYLEELTSTLASLAYKLSGPARSAAELAIADFQTVEAAMTEGHPCFLANSGRLGFSSTDYQHFAPETGSAVRLEWVAAHRGQAGFSCGRGIDYQQLLESELDLATRRRFAQVLTDHGLDPVDYLLIPVHPWQWRHRLSVTFAGEVARQELVWLGAGEDQYQPQQSIRTFFNRSTPGRHYVKTALSVLNMGFLRGLSAAYMAGTPAINDWLAGLIAGDPLLGKHGFAILRERAAVGYRHRQLHAATATGSPYRKMLAALWRESPVAAVRPGEQLVTMAALLHVDRAGDSLAAALIGRSGVAPAAWLRRYLDAYLVPILHCFYAYDLVFMPHGENVILVLDERGVPVRALFKDIAEEIAVMNPELPLPPEVERVRVSTPDRLRTLSVFTDVFDGFFRFLSAILHTGGTLPERRFWATVAACVADYQASMPELADRFRRDDLFAPRFDHSCLNRLQLRDNQHMLDLDDPAGGLQFAGTLTNPIATHPREEPA